MFVINDDLSIYVTRGDMAYIRVTCNKDGRPYTFQAGEVLRFNVCEKKNCDNVVLQKDFPITAVTQGVEIVLDGEDTKFGGIINKPTDYWYEVVLNPFDNPQTIICYDEEGTRVFRLYPEANDKPAPEPKPEVLKVIDTELDMTSERPVQNQAIARAFANLQAGYQATHAAVAALHVTPEMFGAIGDGVADDTEAVQMAVDSGNCVFAKGKTYVVTDMIVLPDNASVDLNGSTILRKFGSEHYGTFKVCNNSKIFNGVINGNYTYNKYGEMDYINHADVWITGEHNTIEEIKFIDSMGESIKIENSYNDVHSCEFTSYADHCIYCKETVSGTAIREAINIYANTFANTDSTREAVKISNGFDRVSIFSNHANLDKGWFLNVDNSVNGYSNGYIDIFDNTISARYFMSVTNLYGNNNVNNVHHNKIICTSNVYKTPLDSTASERNGFSCKQLVFKDNYIDIIAEYMFMFDMVNTGDIIIENNHLRKSYNSGNPRMFYLYGSFNSMLFNGNTIEREQTGDDKFNYPLFYTGNSNIGVDLEGNAFTINGNKFLTCCSPIIQDGALTSGKCAVNCHLTFNDNYFLTVGAAGFRVIAPSAVGALDGITKYLTFKNNVSINNSTIDTGAYPENYIIS